MELLVVVFIIAVLISILLPTMSVIINKAQASKTSAWVATLAAGCETYKTQYTFYPGQDPYWSGVLAKTTVIGPNGYWTALITGSQVLFRTLLAPNAEALPANAMPYGFWEPCSSASGHTLQYWDVGGNCEIAGPDGGRRPGTNGPTDRGVIGTTIADKFSNPMPILYYPARLSGTGLTQFKGTDNSPYWTPLAQTPANADPNKTFSTQNYFNMYITDPSMPNPSNAALASPFREGGFILVSAGIDRKYGRTDTFAAWGATDHFVCDDIRNYSDTRN
jgi:type II secretory pathway pseudopilin PulG